MGPRGQIPFSLLGRERAGAFQIRMLCLPVGSDLSSSCFWVARTDAYKRRASMAGQENVKHIEECSVANAMGTWFFSAAGALIAIPVGIKRKSLAPLVFFGTTGTMLDIIMGISQCEREHAERQAKLLLEAQNSVANLTEAQISAADASFAETSSKS